MDDISTAINATYNLISGLIYNLAHYWEVQSLEQSPSKDSIKKVKRQPNEWEKIFASHGSDNRLVCKIHKDICIADSLCYKAETNTPL